MTYIRHARIWNETRRDTHLHIELDRSFFLDNKLFQQLYPNDSTRFVQEIWYYVDPSRPLAAQDAFEIEIRSGNAPVFVASVPLADIQSAAPNTSFLMTTSAGIASALVPLAGA